MGAPYEDSKGAVYVFFGRPDNVPLERLKLSAESYGFHTPGFGHSIAGGVDIDGNGTPGKSLYLWSELRRKEGSFP